MELVGVCILFWFQNCWNCGHVTPILLGSKSGYLALQCSFNCNGGLILISCEADGIITIVGFGLLSPGLLIVHVVAVVSRVPACTVILTTLRRVPFHWLLANVLFKNRCHFRCSHEYIDLYVQVADSDPIDLLTSPFGGRYCGQIPPRRRISLYRRLILGFFTDKNLTEGILFQGTYVFLKEGFIFSQLIPSIEMNSVWFDRDRCS